LVQARARPRKRSRKGEEKFTRPNFPSIMRS